MGKATDILQHSPAAPFVHVRVEAPGGEELTFSQPFRIGRDETCEVRVPSGQASRVHLEVCFEAGAWWLRDPGSTNGTFRDDRRIETLRLEGPATIRLGRDGPRLTFTADAYPPPARTPALTAETAVNDVGPRTPRVGDAGPIAARSADEPARAPLAPASHVPPPRRPEPVPAARPVAVPQPAAEGAPAERGPRRRVPEDRPPAFVSTQEYVRHYFGPDAEQNAGMHTRMIRRAYEKVHRKSRRRYVWLVGGALVACLLALSYAYLQHRRADRADALLYDLRAQDAEIVRMRAVLEEHFDASLSEQLQQMEARRAQQRERYEGFVEEYGIRRGLSDEEQVIFKMARIFNESQEEMPPAFVRAVREQIRAWQTTGRGRFVNAIRHAQERGYVGPIVRTMLRYDLPPEFFYLALQESNFRTDAVGPPTRFGRAKGMWQFIPETGGRYGLRIGPREDEGVPDPGDERHDFALATAAAGRYLRDIYGTLAQASGLLAMASYNWGERRVVGKLEPLMEGIPDDPQARSYWRFYSVYSDRMPQETKDYVIKIFSAAVIGEDPRLFGFDFDNPIRPYLEAPPGGPATE